MKLDVVLTDILIDLVAGVLISVYQNNLKINSILMITFNQR